MAGNAFSWIDGPYLDVPAPQGTIRSGHFFQGFKTLVRNLGGDGRKILEQHSVDPIVLDDPDYHISLTSANGILEYCSRSLNDPLFGLHLADCQDADVYGCVAALARAAPTLRQGVQSLVDYLPVVHSPEGDLQLETDTDVAKLRWDAYSGCEFSEQANQHGLLLAVKFLQMLAGSHFRPSYASYTSRISQADLSSLQDRLGCKVYCMSEVNAIAFPVRLLDQPIRTANRTLFSLVGGYLEQVKNSNKSTVVNRVETYVRGALPSRKCSIDRCAVKLGTSARTLHKRLSHSGTRFSDIVEIQRTKTAKHALRDTDHSLDEIAHQLGYAEQSSFGRAFKRWTGWSPQAFRDARSKGRCNG